MKLKRLLLLIPVILSGCVHHSNNVQILPSAVPAKVLTKTAIAPSSESHMPGSDTDPWKECADIVDSEPVLTAVSDLENEEFRLRVQITYMIQIDREETAVIGQRCMNGKVYVCEIKDRQNCIDKLDFSTEPKEVLKELCAKPEFEGMTPDTAAIGWNSAYQWICKDGEAVILRQAAEADAAGYDSSLWKEIPAPQ